MDPVLLKVSQAAAMIGREPSEIMDLADEGKLSVVRMGRLPRVVFASVQHYLSTGGGRMFAKASGTPPAPGIARASFLHAQADRAVTKALCYFIGGSEGPIKIGQSKDPKARMASFQTGYPYRLRLLATCAGGAAREAAYHAQFSSRSTYGEWFERCPEILAEIARLTPVPEEHHND